MEINQRLIPASNKETRPGIKMTPKYITIHETDNTNRGADDEAHATLQYKGNTRVASWHYQVDDDSIWQSIPDDEVAWHAGDGAGPGNMSSIAIEICVNSDGNYKKAVENAAWLTKHLMDKHGIDAYHVVQHNHWTGKNCPRHLRAGDWGVTWDDFIAMISHNQYKVVIPNAAFWQARALVREFQAKGFTCYGHNLKTYGPDDKPQEKDPYEFIVKDLTFEKAKALVVHFKVRGYSLAVGSRE